MRNFGLCASILAVSNIVAFTSPAFAQEFDNTRPAAEPEARPPTAPKGPDTASPADDALVSVHVESPTPVSLERRAPGGTTWENLCTTPCDVKTNTVAEYRITGEGLNDSKPFMIDGTKESVNLRVVPGSQARATAGLYVLVGGGILALVGVGIMVLGPDRSSVFSDDGQTHQAHLNTMFFGGALVFAGLGGAIFGTGWMLGNRHTDVSGDVSKVIDEKAAPSNGPIVPAGGNAEVKFSTYNRQPTWSTQKNPGLPQVMSIPLFSGKF